MKNCIFLGIIKIKGSIMSNKYPVLVEDIDDDDGGYRVFIDTTPDPLFHTVLHDLFHHHKYSFKYFGLILAGIRSQTTYEQTVGIEDTLVITLHKDENPYNSSNIDVKLIGNSLLPHIEIHVYKDEKLVLQSESDIDIVKIIENTNSLFKEFESKN